MQWSRSRDARAALRRFSCFRCTAVDNGTKKGQEIFACQVFQTVERRSE
jgi:hypothetical protein